MQFIGAWDAFSHLCYFYQILTHHNAAPQCFNSLFQIWKNERKEKSCCIWRNCKRRRTALRRFHSPPPLHSMHTTTPQSNQKQGIECILMIRRNDWRNVAVRDWWKNFALLTLSNFIFFFNSVYVFVSLLERLLPRSLAQEGKERRFILFLSPYSLSRLSFFLLLYVFCNFENRTRKRKKDRCDSDEQKWETTLRVLIQIQLDRRLRIHTLKGFIS